MDETKTRFRVRFRNEAGYSGFVWVGQAACAESATSRAGQALASVWRTMARTRKVHGLGNPDAVRLGDPKNTSMIWALKGVTLLKALETCPEHQTNESELGRHMLGLMMTLPGSRSLPWPEDNPHWGGYATVSASFGINTASVGDEDAMKLSIPHWGMATETADAVATILLPRCAALAKRFHRQDGSGTKHIRLPHPVTRTASASVRASVWTSAWESDARERALAALRAMGENEVANAFEKKGDPA